ncbi:EcsC family protein [Roseateles chitinivorans]|uniref:EcsC family protein n=1 Tax=Roseateles chitinivorans TaxID=2917965 RepID=UPI003D66D161
MAMTAAHLEELKQAHQLLENPGFAIRAANVLGKPLEFVLEQLPSAGRTAIATATEKALRVTLDGAVATMENKQDEESPILHKVFATVTGAAGGFFGLAALPIELPISTGVIFRSIADVARANGEDLDEAEVKLECLKVFAMGGPSPSDDASETGYLAVRASMARLVTEAADYLAAHAVAEEAAPVLARLIAAIAARFQVQVAEKVAAQAVPVIGAIAGGSINYLFVSHFQEMSRGHFTFRRLSRLYGVDEVTKQYRALNASAPAAETA